MGADHRFSDSATQPALSPDGRMVAFIRGPETFVTPGEIYVKILPDGEPVQLTHDGLPKMAPAFSPDGSRVAFTATDRSFGWNTWVVPVLGGESKELLPNAAALTWVDQATRDVFGDQDGGSHGHCYRRESRAEERDVYLPSSAMEWRTAPGFLPMVNGCWFLNGQFSGWCHAVCFPLMGAPVAKRLVRRQRNAPTQAGARMEGRCISARTRETDSTSGASIFRGAFRNN